MKAFSNTFSHVVELYDFFYFIKYDKDKAVLSFGYEYRVLYYYVSLFFFSLFKVSENDYKTRMEKYEGLQK